jgi:hypothetical protein
MKIWWQILHMLKLYTCILIAILLLHYFDNNRSTFHLNFFSLTNSMRSYAFPLWELNGTGNGRHCGCAMLKFHRENTIRCYYNKSTHVQRGEYQFIIMSKKLCWVNTATHVVFKMLPSLFSTLLYYITPFLATSRKSRSKRSLIERNIVSDGVKFKYSYPIYLIISTWCLKKPRTYLLFI